MIRNAIFTALFLLFAAGGAGAAEVRPFTLDALHEAQAAGKPILVDVHADWCPTCRAQEPALKAIEADPAFAKLVVMVLDFDSQKQEEKALGVRSQSTLIAFAGKEETRRSVGITDPSAIRDLAASALAAAK
ncbi:MAG TPA: thioredoxin family protein [Magnetospirillaceae bacterium]|nr:thioredoxin family protein [Magnetospirillaceae bacterium]